MLRLLAPVDCAPLAAVSGSLLPAGAGLRPLAPVEYRRPSLWWRVRQAGKLCSPKRFPRPTSFTLTDLAAWLVAITVWPFTADVLVPFLARLARAAGLGVAYCELRLRVLHHDAAGVLVAVTDYGLASRKLVTDAGVAYLAADFAGGSNDSNLFKFHAFGSGTTAESASQTALVTEYTTEYATDNTRPTGSQSSSTNVYTTVGTFSPDATVTVSEHGLLTQAANSGGTMWDRSKFTGVGLTGSADSLQATHATTFPSGG